MAHGMVQAKRIDYEISVMLRRSRPAVSLCMVIVVLCLLRADR